VGVATVSVAALAALLLPAGPVLSACAAIEFE